MCVHILRVIYQTIEQILMKFGIRVCNLHRLDSVISFFKCLILYIIYGFT
jgi:hypothetical protein